jgi:uncharacterized membrane protein
MLDWLLHLDIARELVVVVVSALPVSELRGAIPLGINLFHMHWYHVFLLAVIGNLIPVPILLLFFDILAKLISKVEPGKKLMDWVLVHTRVRSEFIRKYERIGLILFVAVPLPITGAWTGSIAAFLMGIRFWYAFFAIFCGIIIAGVIVTCLSLLGWIGAVIAGVGLAILAVAGWRRV